MDDRETSEWMPLDEQLEDHRPPTVAEVVIGILTEHLDLAEGLIRPCHRLKDLGLTPLALVLISLDLEDLEGTVLPYEELENVKTVEGLIRLVQHCR